MCNLQVYLPKDHYTQRAKGFGFIEFAGAISHLQINWRANVLALPFGPRLPCIPIMQAPCGLILVFVPADARDADEAVRDLDGSSIGGRTVSVNTSPISDSLSGVLQMIMQSPSRAVGRHQM